MSRPVIYILEDSPNNVDCFATIIYVWEGSPNNLDCFAGFNKCTILECTFLGSKTVIPKLLFCFCYFFFLDQLVLLFSVWFLANGQNLYSEDSSSLGFLDPFCVQWFTYYDATWPTSTRTKHLSYSHMDGKNLKGKKILYRYGPALRYKWMRPCLS